MKSFVLAIFLMTLHGCGTIDPENGRAFRYTVINETDRDILIRAFSSRDQTENLTTILAGDRLVKTYQSSSPRPADGDLYNFLKFFGGDSIHVIFNDERVLRYGFDPCSNDFKNPLNVCEYSDTNEVFIFTQEDYENAQPCDGNCE